VPPLLDLSINSFVQLDDSISIDIPHSQKTMNNCINQHLPHSISFTSKKNMGDNFAVYYKKNDELETTKTESKDENYENIK
jgi:hypothetical protein